MIDQYVTNGALNNSTPEDERKHAAFIMAVDCFRQFIPEDEQLKLQYNSEGVCCIEGDGWSIKFSIACDSPRAVFTDTMSKLVHQLRDWY